jgi:hypothetical protein
MNARKVWIIACLVWLVAAGAGAWVLSNYQNQAGAAGDTPVKWPMNTALKVHGDKPVLIMFTHPQCPCTRASVEELNRIMGLCGDKVEAQVLFILPENMPQDWTQTALWRNSAAIPGVQNHIDLGGREARLFGAQSSGYVLLYDVHGKLLFHGGITSARGHEGDNAGENVIVALLNGNPTSLDKTPVFGCGLLDQK